jgi:hypothetical protein
MPVTDRRAFAVEVDDELYLFDQGLYAERLAYDNRDRPVRVLGSVKILDAVAARELLRQRRAASAEAAAAAGGGT